MCSICDIEHLNDPRNVPPARHKHDCERCVYLGQHDEYDLYYCEQNAGSATLVARWSDDGPDYVSGLEQLNHPAIARAHEYATALELI